MKRARLGLLTLGATLFALGCDGGGTGAGGGGGGGAAGGAGGQGAGGTGGGGTGGAGGAGGGPSTAACAAASLPAPPSDCALENVRCVDDTAGATQEHATLQEAADAAVPGDTILVFEGSYEGFQIDGSGDAGSPIVYQAVGDVAITSPAPTGDGIRIQNASHVRVIGFRVADVPQRCIAARGATPDAPMVDVWVVGNDCRRAGVEGLYLSELSDSHVELNVIVDSGQSGSTRSHGIYLANAGSDGTTLCGNDISGAGPDESNGIHVNGDLSVGGDGIVSGLLVEANVIHGNAQNGLNLDGVQASVFRNNLVYGNGRNALRAYAIDGAEGPLDLVVVANTLLTPAGGGWPLKLSEDLGGHVVFDNVLLTEDPDLGSISLDASPGFQSAANAVVDRFSADGEASYLTLAEWQALGFDAGSLVTSGAALFVAPGTDFHLLAGAPATDAGLATFAGVSAPALDLEGAARPAGAGWDMGCYERP